MTTTFDTFGLCCRTTREASLCPLAAKSLRVCAMRPSSPIIYRPTPRSPSRRLRCPQGGGQRATPATDDAYAAPRCQSPTRTIDPPGPCMAQESMTEPGRPEAVRDAPRPPGRCSTDLEPVPRSPPTTYAPRLRDRRRAVTPDRSGAHQVRRDDRCRETSSRRPTRPTESRWAAPCSSCRGPDRPLEAIGRPADDPPTTRAGARPSPATADAPHHRPDEHGNLRDTASVRHRGEPRALGPCAPPRNQSRFDGRATDLCRRRHACSGIMPADTGG